MMSFTGSTRAGIAVTKAAADTVKRVTLELGGKSPNIVFADADISKAVKVGALHCFNNTGQSCNAPTRMLVERPAYASAIEVAVATAECNHGGRSRHRGPPPRAAGFGGPVQQGARAHRESHCRRRPAGGRRTRPSRRRQSRLFRPPTVFADVSNDMTIAREEVFGPVLAMIPFDTEDEAVSIANDTPYGLAAYVQSGNQARAQKVARRLRAGMVLLNGAQRAAGSPFGGYKQSGNGREGGRWGIEDYLEVKAIAGWQPEAEA